MPMFGAMVFMLFFLSHTFHPRLMDCLHRGMVYTLPGGDWSHHGAAIAGALPIGGSVAIPVSGGSVKRGPVPTDGLSPRMACLTDGLSHGWSVIGTVGGPSTVRAGTLFRSYSRYSLARGVSSGSESRRDSLVHESIMNRRLVTGPPRAGHRPPAGCSQALRA